MPKKRAKIANLQQGVDAWRERNAFELEGKDWVIHIGSQTVFMPTPAMGSRNCSTAWQCWTPPNTTYVHEGVVKISNEEWRRVRNAYVKDVWVWPADGVEGTCRLLRLHELLAL